MCFPSAEPVRDSLYIRANRHAVEPECLIGEVEKAYEVGVVATKVRGDAPIVLESAETAFDAIPLRIEL